VGRPPIEEAAAPNSLWPWAVSAPEARLTLIAALPVPRMMHGTIDCRPWLRACRAFAPPTSNSLPALTGSVAASLDIAPYHHDGMWRHKAGLRSTALQQSSAPEHLPDDEASGEPDRRPLQDRRVRPPYEIYHGI